MNNLKKYCAVIGAASLLTAPNLFASMSITMMDNTGQYSAGDGGEFRAVVSNVPVDWNAYSSATSGTVSSGTDGGSWGYNSGLDNKQYFQTFCAELYEEFSPGGLYTISSIGDSAMYDNTGHPVPITLGVAYLYSRFAAGSLDGYDYTYGSQRSTTWDLQNAIWDLLGEGGYLASWIQTDLSNGLGGDSSSWTAVANGAYGVHDMVLGEPGQAQDQLVITTSVPEPTTMLAGAMMLLPFAAQGVRALRRKRAV